MCMSVGAVHVYVCVYVMWPGDMGDMGLVLSYPLQDVEQNP